MSIESQVHLWFELGIRSRQSTSIPFGFPDCPGPLAARHRVHLRLDLILDQFQPLAPSRLSQTIVEIRKGIRSLPARNYEAFEDREQSLQRLIKEFAQGISNLPTTEFDRAKKYFELGYLLVFGEEVTQQPSGQTQFSSQWQWHGNGQEEIKSLLASLELQLQDVWRSKAEHENYDDKFVDLPETIELGWLNAERGLAFMRTRVGEVSWDDQKRELRVGDFLVKRFRQPALNQTEIIKAFAHENWREVVDSPTNDQQGLSQTLRDLNNGISPKLIVFRACGAGKMSWHRCPTE